MIACDEIKITGVTNAKKEPQPKHIPSKVQADTLFTFANQLEWIIRPLRQRMLSPRYCTEDIAYLEVDGIHKIAIPMKCFCDINFHRLGEHLNWYGYYGLAFSKEWGMRKKIQPVQYLNPESELRKDISDAFTAALNVKTDNQTKTQELLQNYMLHHIMYCKPYSGKFCNRITDEESDKCYTDECEWRFVSDVSEAGYPQVVFDEDILNLGSTTLMSNAMEGVASISLTFEYSDVKYIIVNTESDFQKIAAEIELFKISEPDKHSLISKIIIWENSKEDF